MYGGVLQCAQFMFPTASTSTELQLPISWLAACSEMAWTSLSPHNVNSQTKQQSTAIGCWPRARAFGGCFFAAGETIFEGIRLSLYCSSGPHFVLNIPYRSLYSSINGTES